MFDVRHIAKLARLGLSKEEEEKFAKEMTAILDFAAKLNEAKTEGTETIAHITGLENMMRSDAAESSSPKFRERFLSNAPQTKVGYLKVKAVFE